MPRGCVPRCGCSAAMARGVPGRCRDPSPLPGRSSRMAAMRAAAPTGRGTGRVSPSASCAGGPGRTARPAPSGPAFVTGGRGPGSAVRLPRLRQARRARNPRIVQASGRRLRGSTRQAATVARACCSPVACRPACGGRRPSPPKGASSRYTGRRGPLRLSTMASCAAACRGRCEGARCRCPRPRVGQTAHGAGGSGGQVGGLSRWAPISPFRLPVARAGLDCNGCLAGMCSGNPGSEVERREQAS